MTGKEQKSGIKAPEIYVPGLTERVERLERKVEQLRSLEKLVRKGRSRHSS